MNNRWKVLIVVLFLTSSLQAKFVISENDDGKMIIASDIITGFEYARKDGTDGYNTTFTLARGRFGISGKIKKDIAYKIRMRVEPVKTKPELDNTMFKLVDNAWISYQILEDLLKVKMGKISAKPGVVEQLDSMHPITFAINDGDHYDGSYGLGMQLSGDLPLRHAWTLTIQNDIEDGAYRSSNQDNKYDAQIDFMGKSKKEIKQKTLNGDLRYQYGVSLSILSPLEGKEVQVLSPYLLVSAYNCLFLAGLETFLAGEEKNKSYNLGFAYAYEDLVRPGISYSLIGIDGALDKIIGLNATFFIDDGRLRPIIEYSAKMPHIGNKAYKLTALLSLDI